MVREVRKDELTKLLQLYTQLHENQIPEPSEDLFRLWEQILDDPKHHIIVAEEEGEILSSCVVVIVPNLTHGQRPYALVENVITEEKHRNQGLASACLASAKELAERERCYKIMLLTGSKQDSTLRFYEKLDYNRNDKTAFIQWLNP